MSARGISLAIATGVAAALVFAGGGAWAADASSPVVSAQRAIRELRYEEARVEIDAAIRRGHHARKDLVALYALRAEVTSILDGASAGEGEFRRLLVLAPDHLPPRDSPIFSVPFSHAQRWVSAHGDLEVEHKIVAMPKVALPTPLAVAVTNDPLAMVAGARLWVRLADEEAFVLVPGASLRPSLPPIPAGSAADYYLEVLDASDNVVAQLGTAEEPFTLAGPAARPSSAPSPLSPPPRITEPLPTASVGQPSSSAPALVAVAPPHRSRSYRVGGGVLAALGLGALGAAIGVDVAGRHQLDTLSSTCAPSCSQAQVDSLKLSEGAAIGLYAAAGVALTTSIVLFAIDLSHSPRHR